MPKRFDPKKKKRDWRWYLQFAINTLVILSMVLGTVFVFTGAGAPSAPPPPTLDVPTLAPTTPASPTPTPRASANTLLAASIDASPSDLLA